MTVMTGGAAGAAAQAAAAAKKGSSDQQLNDFYRFQRREKRRNGAHRAPLAQGREREGGWEPAARRAEQSQACGARSHITPHV